METIRPAEPRDADFLARVILSAARSHVAKGWFDILLARPEPQCLEYLKRLAMAPTRSWWHYSRFHVAEVDGNKAAALCAFRAGDAYPLSAGAMSEVAQSFGWDDAEQQAMWNRGAYVFTCTFEDHDDWWTIENVATLPTYRGRGLTGRLIDHALAEGRRDGLQNAQISFFIGNTPAERAYSKAGFVFDGERRHPDFEAAIGVPGICRYVKPI